MPGTIHVLTEHWQGEIAEVSFEALALGRELATALGTQLSAIVLGHDCASVLPALGVADEVLVADHPTLERPYPNVLAKALATVAAKKQPKAILIPLTNASMGIGTLLGEMLHAPVVNFCRDVSVENGQLRVETLMYGGKVECAVTPVGEPAILGLWPGSRSPEQGRSNRPPTTIETVAVEIEESPDLRLLRYIEPDRSEVNLAEQDVLVAVGRGMQSQDNLALAEELAAALGGVVCGSRPVIDQGWLPMSRQVGKSGATVKPKLYLSAGISGAPEHVEGMRNSNLIVAINSDPNAPIFNVAHYGVVADVLDILPALTARVKARKEEHAHHA